MSIDQDQDLNFLQMIIIIPFALMISIFSKEPEYLYFVSDLNIVNQTVKWIKVTATVFVFIFLFAFISIFVFVFVFEMLMFKMEGG